MGAFTSVTVIGRSAVGEGVKRLIVTAVGPASYDAGGSAIDLSAAALGAMEGFTTVYGGHLLKAAHASTSIKLQASVVGGASATSPKIVLRDADGGTAMAQLSGDVSGYTITMEFVGV